MPQSICVVVREQLLRFRSLFFTMCVSWIEFSSSGLVASAFPGEPSQWPYILIT